MHLQPEIVVDDTEEEEDLAKEHDCTIERIGEDAEVVVITLRGQAHKLAEEVDCL